MPTTHDKNLEYRLFLMACAICIFVATVLFIIDTFIAHKYNSSTLEVSSIFIFGFFYYQARIKDKVEKMIIPFQITLLAIINIAWFTGGGLNLTNAFVFYLVLILIVIITPQSAKAFFMVLIFINLVIFSALEFLYPEYSMPVIKNDQLIVINTIALMLIFSITAYVLSFFKNQYEFERDLVHKKNLELDSVNSEIETQNEELIQYQEEVMTQRDFIEEKNKMLERQAVELEKANEQVTAVNTSLEKTVEERTKKLVNLNNDLDLLVYRSSHDFRRPLTTLMGLNEVARLTLIDDFSKELFSKVHNTAVMMDKMLLKFFMLYNINHFRSTYEGSTLDEIIDRIDKNLISRKSSIEFTRKVELTSYKARDERNSLIEIILENLFENSLTYNSKSKIIVDLKIVQQNGTIHIQHYDNGNGIPYTYFKKVYDMYFRGSTLSTGNGLGLYVVKRAADLLNATIELDSREGEYTRFDIIFPT